MPLSACLRVFLNLKKNQISHSWDICQRFYDDPDWANRPGGPYFADDDDMDLDGEDLFEFYM